MAIAEANSPPSVGEQSTSGSSGPVGGPLIGSLNGAIRGATSDLNMNSSGGSMFPSGSTFDELEQYNDCPTSTWDVGTIDERSITGWDRPESRQSLTSASSPLYSAPSQRSPAATTLFPNTFSPIEEPTSLEEHKENKETLYEKDKEGESGDSAKLRILLTSNNRSSTDTVTQIRPSTDTMAQIRPSTDSDDGSRGRNKNVILKTLLKVDDEKDCNASQSSDLSTTKGTSGNNNMLLKVCPECYQVIIVPFYLVFLNLIVFIKYLSYL